MRSALLLALGVAAGLGAPGTPALFQSGSIPVLAVMSVEVGGGQVLLEVTVDRTGAVKAIKPLRETATFTERVVQSVMTWRFTPTEAESKVLVAGVFRPPVLIGPTFGEPIRDVASASNDVPYPASIITPSFPPMVLDPGVALVEVRVDATGAVTSATARRSAPGFDAAAIEAARLWKFRPATIGGAGAPAVVYILFGFPVPRS